VAHLAAFAGAATLDTGDAMNWILADIVLLPPRFFVGWIVVQRTVRVEKNREIPPDLAGE
jgi:hypothetical protein